MKRMTDEEFSEADRLAVAFSPSQARDVLRTESKRARAREARLEAALKEIRDADYHLRRMDMMRLARQALEDE